MEKEIKADENTEYVYVGPNLAKDMEELAKFRAELKRQESARDARRAHVEKARMDRATTRESMPVVEVSAETIAKAFDRFTPFVADVRYVEHFVQEYCGCEPDSEGGWFTCEHARDLGIYP